MGYEAILQNVIQKRWGNVSQDNTWRVLHILPSLDVGGSEIWLAKIVSNMDHHFDNMVVSLGSIGPIGQKLQKNGVAVVALDIRPRMPNPLRIWKLLSIAKKFNPHLIVGWLYHGNFFSTMTGWLLHRPVIWNIHQCLPKGYSEKKTTVAFLWLGKILSRMPSCICYNSIVAGQQHSAIGYCSNKVQYFFNEAQAEVFRASPESYVEVRKELNIPITSKIVGLIARFHAVKGHSLFFEAANILVHEMPEVHFLLVGSQVTWENPDLKKYVEQTKIFRNQIHLMGEQSLERVAFYTAGLDIATCCSFAEARPHTVLEAIACQVPCVAVDVGDIRNMLTSRDVLVAPHNPKELANGWLKVFSNING